MANIPTIRILEEKPKKIGDLFGRLMTDLFLALGYDQVRLNIHKTGREIDIEAIHRTESRRIIAECKATEDNIGGDDINKFVGVLDVEKRKESNTLGYFISLSGFKQTAIEQEKEAGGGRVILLNGNQVVDELIKGHILVPPDKAMERAGRCAAEKSKDLKPEESCELLAHEMGWVWAVYFQMNKQKTHFALIHADGEAIAEDLAGKIIQADNAVGGVLRSLSYLPPKVEAIITESQIQEAQKKYYQYLAVECGEITLEGLPADQEVGSRRLTIENIFVPLYLEPSIEYVRAPSLSTQEKLQIASPKVKKISIEDEHESSKKKILEKDPSKTRKSVGEILSKCSRLAILAAPGGGKTTLLKRLAIAYAFPERRKLVDDNLPDRPWFPLFIRCRQLGDLVNSPINDILRSVPQRVEMADLTKTFIQIVNDALRSGNVLLLIDGLDEISDESKRIAFIKQLRIFLAVYPSTNIIVSSREAGFRIVGGALSTHCEHYKVADFDNNDITRLTLAWHKEVVGDRPDIRTDAEKLAETICDSDRVRQLAKNPLLLTTLLLVKRWVGQLPTRRSVLYGKAIEVLLMTWNVEGYEPIDQEEAIPQLAFVAFTMMKDGVQRISSRRLTEILNLARKQMPEVLGYAKFSVSEFINRVELRSSLLVMSGYEIEQGTLYSMYEFRHLTFQEYLTARAIVDGYYPDRKETDTILTILKPNLQYQHWKEVVPLAGVLAGRKVESLVRYLIRLCRISKVDKHHRGFQISPVVLLAQCILDEVLVEPKLLEEGLQWIARRSMGPSQLISLLYKSKFGGILKKVVQDAFISSDKDLSCLGSTLSDIIWDQINWEGLQDLTPQLVQKITTFLVDENPIQKAFGALAIMDIAYSSPGVSRLERQELNPDAMKLLMTLGDQLVPLLYSDKAYVLLSACWAFAWLGEIGAWSPKNNLDVLSRLFDIWRKSQLPDVQHKASWALSVLPIIQRELKPLHVPDSETIVFIKEQSLLKEPTRKRAALVTGFYWRTPWNDDELSELVVSADFNDANLKSLLRELGEYGQAKLQLLKQKKESRLLKPKTRTVIRSKKPKKRQLEI